jgi:hypothetical protein
MKMKKEETEIKIEQAKSYFSLAQLLMILAGFLLASAGIAWTNTLTAIDMGNKLNEQAINNMEFDVNYSLQLVSLSKQLNKLGQTQIDYLNTYGKFGIILIGISLIIWGWGNYKINRIKPKTY